MIQFDIGSCSLGCVLVAMSSRGVCAIAMADGPDELLEWIDEKYPHAQRGAENTDLDHQLHLILNYAEAPDLALDIPLDMVGTPFQKRVWQALQTVPAGQTCSYSAIAEMIGQPKAIRAVAGACAANSLALAVPCHRIIKKDGSLSGYRWGMKRKQILLQREALS